MITPGTNRQTFSLNEQFQDQNKVYKCATGLDLKIIS
jgi:hypothetical protein